MSTTRDIGQTIRERRERLGLTRVALSEAAKVNRMTLAGIEDGTKSFRQSTLWLVERALDEMEGRTGTAQRATPQPDETPAGMVTLRLSGRGVDVTVQGPASDLAELEATATRLLAAVHDPRILP